MARDNPSDLPVEAWLKTVGVECFCQWDVLVFLHHHRTSLVSAEHIARLVGYPTAAVVAALDGLESLDLVERSRVDQGVRLYQLTTTDAPRGDALARLLTVAGTRPGRLLLAQLLQPGERPAQTNGHTPLRRSEGRATWLKAI